MSFELLNDIFSRLAGEERIIDKRFLGPSANLQHHWYERPDRRALAALCRTCKRFKKVARPHLWASAGPDLDYFGELKLQIALDRNRGLGEGLRSATYNMHSFAADERQELMSWFTNITCLDLNLDAQCLTRVAPIDHYDTMLEALSAVRTHKRMRTIRLHYKDNSTYRAPPVERLLPLCALATALRTRPPRYMSEAARTREPFTLSVTGLESSAETPETNSFASATVMDLYVQRAWTSKQFAGITCLTMTSCEITVDFMRAVFEFVTGLESLRALYLQDVICEEYIITSDDGEEHDEGDFNEDGDIVKRNLATTLLPATPAAMREALQCLGINRGYRMRHVAHSVDVDDAMHQQALSHFVNLKHLSVDDLHHVRALPATLDTLRVSPSPALRSVLSAMATWSAVLAAKLDGTLPELAKLVVEMRPWSYKPDPTTDAADTKPLQQYDDLEEAYSSLMQKAASAGVQILGELADWVEQKRQNRRAMLLAEAMNEGSDEE